MTLSFVIPLLYNCGKYISACLDSTLRHGIGKENGGVSSARNCGIMQARGKYIRFMDADDYLLPSGMGILIKTYLKKDHDEHLHCRLSQYIGHKS